MRILVVWCPDWSVVAALREAERSPTDPAAVLAGGVVEVCNGSARAEGVRRGQRRRDAQARCPELVLLEANPDRDARHFEPVLETVEALRPGVASLRPGLLAVRAPGRWYGGEDNAAAVLAECLVDAGVWDCRLGVADDLFTAEQAARRARVQECELVPAGGSPAYLRELPVEVLEADGPEGREAVSLLRRLGLRTLGDLAALPLDAVQDRFGRYGARVWRQARGEAPTHLAARRPPPDLTAEISFEPPLDSVEAICFSVRTTAERLVTELAARQLVATGVRIEAEHDAAVASARTWLHPRYFSVKDLVDRVHWQLQGSSSLRSRQSSGHVRAPVERVRFVPEVVEPAAAHTEGLWGGAGEELVERGVARVQAMVGFDAVTRPVLQGGRGPAERQGAVPWGERGTGLRPPDRPWPGRLPGPAPCRVFGEPAAAEVCDQTGRTVAVTDRGVVTGEPTRFRLDAVTGSGWQPVLAWAGPWPVDESWWSEGGDRVSRFQLVGADGRAWLLACGSTGWRVEAGYD
jgi:protein ImuB